MELKESNRYRAVVVAMIVGGILILAAATWAFINDDDPTPVEKDREISSVTSTN